MKKSVLKKLFLVLILVAAIFVYAEREVVAAKAKDILYKSPCNTPIPYRIGTIDKRFAITTDEFAADVEKAAGIWSNAWGKKIFVYDPEAELDISLSYDQRQALNSKINQMNSNLKEENKAMKPEIAEYESRSANFRARVTKLNEEIESWNTKGGAPPEEYERLKAEQESLQKEAEVLNSMARSLNRSTTEYNQQVDKLSDTIDVYNEALRDRPEEGIYRINGANEEIIIYFYSTRQELIHTLAHEMGHALGIGHVKNPQAIMYHRTNDVTVPASDDLTGLEVACQKQNVILMEGRKLSLLLHKVATEIQAKLNKQQVTNDK